MQALTDVGHVKAVSLSSSHEDDLPWHNDDRRRNPDAQGGMATTSDISEFVEMGNVHSVQVSSSLVSCAQLNDALEAINTTVNA
jgi:hypothetical protein